MDRDIKTIMNNIISELDEFSSFITNSDEDLVSLEEYNDSKLAPKEFSLEADSQND